MIGISALDDEASVIVWAETQTAGTALSDRFVFSIVLFVICAFVLLVLFVAV